MTDNGVRQLTFDQLRSAVAGPAAAIRLVQRLQPAGGTCDKVFPPTYVGGLYAVESRQIDGRETRCVQLDSVQSQANRLEQALQKAIDDGMLQLPLLSADFSKHFPDVGRITALEAPHRISDAIFRDSNLGDVPFRESSEGKAFEGATVKRATAMFELCPTALLFGTWDSTGSKGGLGNKFARVLVSEIVGIDVVFGVRTSSRIDPLGVEKCDLFQTRDGGWTTEPAKAALDEKGNPIKYGKNKDTRGKPSAINHGNVTPDLVRYKDFASTPDWLKASDIAVDWSIRCANGDVTSRSAARTSESSVRKGDVAVGGVTMAYALQITVLSLTGLRRLRFPAQSALSAERARDRDQAARVVLAALGLAAVALQREHGYFLRSRCDLVQTDAAIFEIVRTATDVDHFTLSGDQAVDIFGRAVKIATDEHELPWRVGEIRLDPAPALLELVAKSRQLGGAGEDD